MKLKADVYEQELCGDEAIVTLGNVQRVAGADWKYCREKICLNVPLSSIKSYPLGRKVIIEVKPK